MAQPVTPSRSAAELHDLLDAAGEEGPFVLAAHSYGGIVARYYAHEFPGDVAGMVLIDSFSPELREAMPDQWPAWIEWNTTPDASSRTTPTTNGSTSTMPSTRSWPTGRSNPCHWSCSPPTSPTRRRRALVCPDDIHLVTRAAQDVSQRLIAQLVPGAEHVTETDSGHDIMLDNPRLVSIAILDVVAAVRDGRTTVR